MKCLLEDRQDSILSQFFKAGAIEKDVMFTASNSNLWSAAKSLSEDTIIFLDINPWNKQLTRLYSSLADRARNGTKKNVIILPIVCAEYNLLYGIRDRSDLIIHKEAYNLILHKEQGGGYAKYGSKTYEKFCKQLLDNGVVDKLSTNKNINPDYLYYTVEDCDKWDIKYRQLRFYQQYRAVPLRATSGNLKLLTFKDIFTIHQSMIDDYNIWAKAVKSSGILRKQNYSDIFE